MGKTIVLAATGGTDLPESIQVASLHLSRVPSRPIFVRALGDRVVICVALRDDGQGWSGFVTARFGTHEVPDQVDEVGLLCQATADTLRGCAGALGEIICIGLRQSDPSSAGRAALTRLEGDDLF